METFAIVTYVVSGEILELLEISDDHQAQMTQVTIHSKSLAYSAMSMFSSGSSGG